MVDIHNILRDKMRRHLLPRTKTLFSRTHFLHQNRSIRWMDIVVILYRSTRLISIALENNCVLIHTFGLPNSYPTVWIISRSVRKFDLIFPDIFWFMWIFGKTFSRLYVVRNACWPRVFRSVWGGGGGFHSVTRTTNSMGKLNQNFPRYHL